jgi:hypothetical protein
VVKDHWDENWAYYREDPVGYFRDIYTAIRTRQYPFFRWHVGGDIPDYQYLAYMIHLAHALPQVKFLTYTKRYELNFANFPIIPENIVFVMSCWPGYPLPSINTDLPRFWVQDGRETRIPEDAFECPGKCETCRKCWNLKKGENVVIKKHGRYKGSPDQLFLCLE